jgi:hypothetical protein
MRAPKKRVTRELIREYFGRNARIRGFGGHYRVKTPTGGEVVVRPNKIKLIFGGEDTYKAVVLLSGYLWGHGVAKGSREFMMGAVAHGEACGVNVRADHSDGWAVVRRIAAAIVLLLLGLVWGARSDNPMMIATVLAIVCVWFVMKRKARREEQRRAEAMGFHYPRVHGAEFADEEDLEKGGLL